MQPWTWVAIGGLAIFLAVILWAVIRLGRMASEVQEKVDDLQREVSVTLRQAQETLGRVETLVQRSDLLLRDKVSPSLDIAHSTLEHVERSAMRMADGVERIQGTAKMLAAMGAPGAMAMLMRRIPGRGGRLGFLALAAGAVVRALLARHPNGSEHLDYAPLPDEEDHAPLMNPKVSANVNPVNPEGTNGPGRLIRDEGPLAVARVEP
jgi:hypothetical protein